MKNLFSTPFFVALLCTISFTATAQSLQHQWSLALTGTDPVSIVQCANDAQGNLYVIGTFQGTVDFDPGSGTANLTAPVGAFNANAFLAKYDAQGNYVFAFQVGDSGSVNFRHLVIDNAGNICAAGSIDTTADLDPAPGIAMLDFAGGIDIFVARYDAAGNYLNAFSIGGPKGEFVDDIDVDAAGNIYIAGYFSDTADFDPGAGVYNLSTGTFNDNGFFAKYTSSGSMEYAYALTSSDHTDVQSIAIDGTGSVFIGGMFHNTIDMDPGPGTVIANNISGSDGYWAKYGPSGNYITHYTYNGGVNFLSLDNDGNFYASGRAFDTMDMDPGPGVANIISENTFDIYFAKYDNQGNYIDAHVFESNYTCLQNEIATNQQGALYMVGRLPDTMYCIPGNTSTGVLTSQGGQDAFFVKFDASCDFEMAYSFGSTTNDQANSIATDNSGNVWMVGNFTGTIDLDFSNATANVTTSPSSGAFIAKYTDETAAGIATQKAQTKEAKIFAAESTVYIDFSLLSDVNANVKAINTLGQTITTKQHRNNNVLKINLPPTGGQIYVVVVENGGVTIARKVWIE